MSTIGKDNLFSSKSLVSLSDKPIIGSLNKQRPLGIQPVAWSLMALALVLDCSACGSGLLGACLGTGTGDCVTIEQREQVHRDWKSLALSQIANNFDCIALG
jgi:hypothetical protein